MPKMQIRVYVTAQPAHHRGSRSGQEASGLAGGRLSSGSSQRPLQQNPCPWHPSAWDLAVPRHSPVTGGSQERPCQTPNEPGPSFLKPQRASKAQRDQGLGQGDALGLILLPGNSHKLSPQGLLFACGRWVDRPVSRTKDLCRLPSGAPGGFDGGGSSVSHKQYPALSLWRLSEGPAAHRL